MDTENGTIRFPRVNPTFLSDTVLVESWAAGETVSDWMAKEENQDPNKQAYFLNNKTSFNYDPNSNGKKQNVAIELTERQKKVVEIRKKLSDTLFDMNLKMFLRDNLIHADLHSGNLIFNEKTGEVTVVDAGMAVSLEKNDLNGFGDFMRAAIIGDVTVMV